MKVLLCLLLIGVVAAQDREGKFFGKNFFKELEKQADQLTQQIFRSPTPFESRLGEQISSALPPWLQSKSHSKKDFDHIEAIEGSFGGVDDGLTVHYDDNDSYHIKAKYEPNQEGPYTVEIEDLNNGQVRNVKVDEKPTTPKPITNIFNTQDIFKNLFKSFALEGSLSLGGRRGAWWQGENVCVDRDETDEFDNVTMPFFISSESSYCRENVDIYQCKTTTHNRGIKKELTVTYRCCHGYAKIENVCTKVEQKTLSELMDDMGTNFFENLISSSDINNIIDTENLTLFVPSNEAIQEFTAELEVMNESNDILELESLDHEDAKSKTAYRVKRSDTSDIVKSLVVPGFHFVQNFKDEQILETKQKGATIRINTFAGNPPVLTANCARVTAVNQRATNGVIHSIDRMINPVSHSIIELIKGNPKFSILTELLKHDSVKALLEKLEKPGQLTLFAPTDDAFKTLPESTLAAMMEGSVCLDAILKNHILPNVICSAPLGPKSRTINILEDYLYMIRNEDDELTVGDAKVLEKDIMATNGVIYAIDKPLIPTEAKSVLDVLTDRNLTEFLSLLEAANMLDEFAKMSDITVFAPSNRAIQDLEDEYMDKLMNDEAALRNFLNYHITSPSLNAVDVTNNHILDTNSGHPLRLNMYSTFPLLNTQIGRTPVKVTAGCSRVSEMDNRACGGIVHVIEEVLEVPQESIMDRLVNDETFSIFSQILKDSGVSETLTKEGDYTVLAPSDYVFKTLPEDELKMLMEDMDMKTAIAKKHVLKDHVCCSGINANRWLFMDHKRTMEGNSLHVRKTHNGRYMAGPARITSCGKPTKNGVVHTVNHLLHDIKPKNPANDINRLNSRRVMSSPSGLEVFISF